LDSPAVKDVREKIALVYGSKLAKDLLEVNYRNDFAEISGFISKPYDARNDKGQQVLFVNGRLVRNSHLSNAVYEGYHSLLFVGKHPIFLLRLSLDPQKVDVNVHPQKSEIRIEQVKEVSQSVAESVRLTLELNNLIPSLDFAAEQQLTFGFRPEVQRKEIPLKSFDLSSQQQFRTVETSASYLSPSYPLSSSPSFSSSSSQPDPLFASPSFFLPSESSLKVPPLRLLGQVHKTFFLAETLDGVFLIDQHVVQERILYERFMEQYLDSQVAVQQLLSPDLVEFTASDAVLLEENLSLLQQMGFLLEPFGTNTFLIKGVPTVFGRLQTKESLLEIISGLKDGLDKFKETQEEIITRMACRASVKAGDILSNAEMLKLLEDLEKCHLPYTCPHGRAILIKITLDELEKKFRRK
jgi:DNA mismatch repair protein MutL